jgi:hypothetical protein
VNRRLRRRHALAARVLMPLAIVGFVWATWAGPRETLAERLASQTRGGFDGEVTRVVEESALGRLELVLSIDLERDSVRILDDTGTTYADLLVYWSPENEVDGLPGDARLIGTVSELLGTDGVLPSRDGALHFFSLGHGALAASRPLIDR